MQLMGFDRPLDRVRGHEDVRDSATGSAGPRSFGACRHTHGSLRAVALRHRLGIAIAVLIAACALLAAPTAAARSAFDHESTGFVLDGLHRNAPCESCHVGGIFKGTPHDCATCHSAGAHFGATFKPTRHIISSSDCSQCHTPFGWSPVAAFNHLNVIGSCSSCHNGVQATGKPTSHIPTTAECSTCHLVTMPWVGVYFAHTGITGDCASCHDNVHAPGQPPTHVPTGAACETCHAPTNFLTFGGTSMNHAGITNNCQSCHETGMTWYGVTMVDRPTPAQDSLHPTAGSPNGADCSNCHVGFNVGDFGMLKPSNHIPTASTAQCANCHASTNWSVIPTQLNIHTYAPSTTANCAQCHGSSVAAGFAIPSADFSIVTTPSNHVPTTAPLRSLPRRRGLERDDDAGVERRQVLGLGDEPRRHHDLRRLPRADGHRRQLRRRHWHRRDAGDHADGARLRTYRRTPRAKAATRRRCRPGSSPPTATDDAARHEVRDSAADDGADPRRSHERLRRAATRAAICGWTSTKYPISPTALSGDPTTQYTGLQYPAREAAASTFGSPTTAHPSRRRLQSVPHQHELLRGRRSSPRTTSRRRRPRSARTATRSPTSR